MFMLFRKLLIFAAVDFSFETINSRNAVVV